MDYKEEYKALNLDEEIEFNIFCAWLTLGIPTKWLPVRRTHYNGWYIQSKPCNHGAPGYMSWASKEPTRSALAKSSGDVYFEFGDTEYEAVEKLKAELLNISDNRQ